jgi:hypothetical protein
VPVTQASSQSLLSSPQQLLQTTGWV